MSSKMAQIKVPHNFRYKAHVRTEILVLVLEVSSPIIEYMAEQKKNGNSNCTYVHLTRTWAAFSPLGGFEASSTANPEIFPSIEN